MNNINWVCKEVSLASLMTVTQRRDDVTVSCLSDSILDSLLPGGLRQGRRCRNSSKDLFMSFIRALQSVIHRNVLHTHTLLLHTWPLSYYSHSWTCPSHSPFNQPITFMSFVTMSSLSNINLFLSLFRSFPLVFPLPLWFKSSVFVWAFSKFCPFCLFSTSCL